MNDNRAYGLTSYMVGFILMVLALLTLTTHNINKTEQCNYSPYQVYSNATSSASYFFGECHVRVQGYYETRKECGIFGISCYEASESHTKSYTTSVCFELKTGERC